MLAPFSASVWTLVCLLPSTRTLDVTLGVDITEVSSQQRQLGQSDNVLEQCDSHALNHVGLLQLTRQHIHSDDPNKKGRSLDSLANTSVADHSAYDGPRAKTESHVRYVPEKRWLTNVLGCLFVMFFLSLVFSCLLQCFDCPDKLDVDGGVAGTSMVQTVFNIVKALLGSGMLTLPAAVAAGTGTGVLMAITLATLFGAFYWYTFSVMGRVCEVTDSTTHKECGEKTVSPIFGQFMSIIVILQTCGICLEFSIVIGSSFSQILHFYGVDGVVSSPPAMLVIVMMIIIAPLCLQRDLSILSYTSFIGICGEVFVVFFMQARYLDGSYSKGGAFYDAPIRADMQAAHAVDSNDWGMCIQTLVLVSILSLGFSSHSNAPKFYMQMRNRSPRRFSIAVAWALGFVTIAYALVMVVGYLTFGNACDSLILSNYSEDDPWATVARLGLAFSVTFGFPLIFTALRDSTISTFALDPTNSSVFVTVTFMLLVPTTVAGCFIRDIVLVNGLNGAICCVMIAAIFPALLCYGAARQPKGRAEFGRIESSCSLLVVAVGCVLCILGIVVVIWNS